MISPRRRRFLSFNLRTLFVALTCCWAVGRLTASEPEKTDLAAITKAMQGKWIVVDEKLGGETQERGVGGEMTIDGDKIYGCSGELTSTFKVDPQEDSMHIDLFAPTQSGMAQMYGIFKVDESTLTIACGGRRPTAFDDWSRHFYKLARKSKTDKR